MLPILYQSPELILYSYPLLMGLGWGVGYQIYFSLLPAETSRFRGQFYFWGIFLFAWLGAKILFYLTYPENSEANLLSEVSFWTGGGFVFYGGLIGALMFLAMTRIADKKFSLRDLWPMVPALVLGHGIGRIGCFLAGCCFGEPTDWPWGIYLHDHYRHPTQIIESLGLLIMGGYFLKSKLSPKTLMVIYLVGYGMLRLVVESLRGDIVRGSWGSLTPSQWISCLLIAGGFGLYFYNKNHQLKQ